MSRIELTICTLLLIAFVAGTRWVLTWVNEAYGIGVFLAVCLGVSLVVLTASYVVERRRGNLPDWLLPRDQRRQPPC